MRRRWMIRAGLFATLAATVLVTFVRIPAGAEEVHDTSAGKVRVERVAGGLDVPWAFDFLPDGGLLVTEKEGILYRYDPEWRRAEVAGVPEVAPGGQGGLLDVTVARDFAETRTVFLTWSDPAEGGARTAMGSARLSEDGRRLENLTVLFAQTPVFRGGRHFGSRVVEAPDGTLFVTTGDRGEETPSQDPDGTVGKVVRIARDGTVPADNPFVAGGASPEIWSLGHRNIQGAALDADGTLWTIEHGARGGDEINVPEAGKNYGWPVISYGRNYSGTKIGVGTRMEGMEQPRGYWDPSIAPSGLMVYSGRLFPEWEGDVFTGSLKADYLSRVDREDLSPGAVNLDGRDERLFADDYIRIRDVAEAPDGSIWFLAVGDGAIYRVTPAD